MMNRALSKNKFSFHPIKDFFYGMIARMANKKAAKMNQPYLEFVDNHVHSKAWANFQYIHSKLIFIDRLVSIIGSYNLEEWSADKSHEIAAVCMDDNLSRSMDISFLKDMVNSVPVTVTENANPENAVILEQDSQITVSPYAI